MFLDSPKDFSPISLLIHYSHVILFFTSNEYFFDFHNSLLMEGEDKSTHKDYYKVLEVEYDATDEKIRLNYRKLALKWHPDKHGGDSAVTEKFQEINEAYKVLSDPDKRLDYDLNGNYEIDKYTLREYLSRFKGMILTCNGLGISHTSIW
ncbi:uncharacterized protein LOC111388338 isoform X2 [Olea europaea var. sylvestris]|nr:uncharacterized protein LOC111388338 isoform X2 [Olea europaea var. sylvestris]CAA2963336.1 Hypothetical predicted protein [Olea europaea subsp. europaea]